MQRLSLLIKPASSLCNMRCHYCFYHDEAALRSMPSYGVMQPDTTEKLIARIIEATGEHAHISLAFQGGEPTLAGLDYFRDLSRRMHAVQGTRQVSYALQTNGLLLDDAWCTWLKEENVLVGLSLDPSPHWHDTLRPDAAGKGTYARVREAARLLDRHGVEYNLLCVITRGIARRPAEAMRWLAAEGFHFVQFIPCLDPLEEGAAGEYSLTPRQYGAFLKGTFDEWLKLRTGKQFISIRYFDNLTAIFAGRPPEMCGILGHCTPQYVVEGDGSVFPCDFYALDETLCGRLQDLSFAELSRSEAMQRFLAPAPLPEACRACPFVRLCGGGCKRYRSFYYHDAGYCPLQDFLAARGAALQQVALQFR